jgi:acetamidase/formamidase
MMYNLEPTQETLVGRFSRDHAPILTIESGETIAYRTLDSNWGLEPLTTFDSPRKHFEPRDPLDAAGHAMIGPVAIRGAQPGMTLGVEIGAIIPGRYGFCLAGGWDHPLNRHFNLVEGVGEHIHTWTLDPIAMTGRNQHGHSVTLRPFMGIMGVAPAEAGQHDTPPPRKWGGNLDCKVLTSGSTLYLPIGVEGALFYVGDGHARQGDGEVSVTGIECPMERVELTFHVHDNLPLERPRAHTPEGWVTFGLDADLNVATMQALQDMLTLMQNLYTIGLRDALALASLVVDLRVTQIVNGVRGIHAVLPHDAIQHHLGV